MVRILLISLLSLFLLACGTPSPRMTSELQQGQRYFEDGYYKRAMHELLPLACDGSAEAQYAIGYMYYYGYGVAQDTDVGYFWIKRAANQQYKPAVEALAMIGRERDERFRARDKLFNQ